MRWSLCSPSSCAWAHGGKSPSGCRDAWGVRQRVEHPGSVPPSRGLSLHPVCLPVWGLSLSPWVCPSVCLSITGSVPASGGLSPCPGSVPLSRGLFLHPGLCSSIPSSVPLSWGDSGGGDTPNLGCLQPRDTPPPSTPWARPPVCQAGCGVRGPGAAPGVSGAPEVGQAQLQLLPRPVAGDVVGGGSALVLRREADWGGRHGRGGSGATGGGGTGTSGG